MQYKLIRDVFGENLTQIILENRGIKDWQTYLSLDESIVENYCKLNNISKATECFIKHYNKHSPISILVDEDVDGFTSAALVYSYIKRMDANYPVKYIIHKKAKSHGLEEDGVTIDIPSDTTLLIIPDAGTNDVKSCKEIQKRGIDIIILDHHISEGDNPYAIIVNNQTSIAYNNKQLCGAGIVYKFLQALDFVLWNEYADDYLDLVALANISDNMDMREFETRYLTDTGLKQIRNPMFLALIDAQQFQIQDHINIHNVQWYVTPLINALIRVASIEEKELLFRAFVEDDEEFIYKKRATKNSPAQEMVETIYERVARLCKNAKSRQDNVRKKSIEEIKKLIGNNVGQAVMVDVTSVLDNSLTGVVAAKVADIYQRPCILLQKRKNGYGGSMRNFDHSPITDFKAVITSCKSFQSCMGHPNAAGVSLGENIEEARKELEEKLKDVVYDLTYFVDFVFPADFADYQTIYDIASLSDIVAQGINAPSVAITDVKLKAAEISLLGSNKNTVSFNCNGVKYIAFTSEMTQKLIDWKENCWDEDECVKIELVGEPSINTFDGLKELQIVIKDFNILGFEKNEYKTNEDDDFDW